MEGLGSRLLGLAAAALELPAGQFTPFFVRHASALRALRYPPLERPPAPGRLRAGEHSDYGSFTILLPGPEPGLEVLTRAGDWLAVPPVPGAFVVNVGDLMQRWTNDRWVSTVHRVRAPEGEWAGRSRRSIAFFQNPHPDAVVTVLPGCVPAGEEPSYEPVVFADWLRAKVAAATG
jgi:isopenicillin N synthase-like dioxygenase